jgi:hypothetical protein
MTVCYMESQAIRAYFDHWRDFFKAAKAAAVPFSKRLTSPRKWPRTREGVGLQGNLLYRLLPMRGLETQTGCGLPARFFREVGAHGYGYGEMV